MIDPSPPRHAGSKGGIGGKREIVLKSLKFAAEKFIDKFRSSALLTNKQIAMHFFPFLKFDLDFEKRRKFMTFMKSS